MKKFNITGTCVPDENYMVDITNKLVQIKAMIDDKAYFTINRGRQYGKTTTLYMLESFLADEYVVASISFEGLGTATFSNETDFCQTFLQLIHDALAFANVADDYQRRWLDKDVTTFSTLSRHITKLCKGEKLVLLIDEVDKCSNNVVFLDFLSKLRNKYLARRVKKDDTFHSVILAGVYDIKNIKLKMIQEEFHGVTEEKTAVYNSPWNIATSFKVEMSFSTTEIESMLIAYENAHQLGINVTTIAEEIYHYTGGYPVLVSSICKYIDEELEKDWSVVGVWKAVKLLLVAKDSPLFESLIKNLSHNEKLAKMTYDILMRNGHWSFSYTNALVGLGSQYGFFKNTAGKVGIFNPIFEMMMTDYFVNLDKSEAISANVNFEDQLNMIQNGRLNMEICLEKFAQYYHEHYSHKAIEFLHEEARYLLLFFLNPILNGKGFVHNEDQLRDGRKIDLVVTYLSQQFIIELKIWRGKKRHQEGFEQLLGYMNKKNLNEGYVLTFDFNENKKTGSQWIQIDDKRSIFDIKV